MFNLLLMAVKDIMYPSHVASTTADDKLFFYKVTHPRNLIPRNIDARQNISKPFTRRLTIDRAQWMQYKKVKNGGAIAKALNETA